MYSIALYLLSNLWSGEPIFAGWTANAAIASVLGGAGGLMVALTMKYTDAVLKTFATSGAIIVTAVSGHFFLGQPLDIPIGIGASCTVLSLLNYSDDGGVLAAAAASAASEGKDRTNGAKAAAGAGTEAAAVAGTTGAADSDDEATQSLMTRTGAPNESAA